jgi:methanogenic corrinoid protein MtbC1
MDPVHPPDQDARRSEGITAALRDAYREALVAGMPAAAERAIRDAIDAGMAELEIDDEIITPAMRFVGDRWAAGDMTVAQEHLATSISFRVIALQHERFRVARRRAQTRVMLAALEGEQHVLGLEMAASALLHAGYDVRMLGADVPTAELGDAIRQHQPSLVGFTTTRVQTATGAYGAIAAARVASPTVSILVGGGAARDIGSGDPTVTVCTHVGDVLDLADALVQRAALN